MRTNEKKSEFISKTVGTVSDQEAWLKKYKEDPSQEYFVIYDQTDRPVGTIRLYDVRGDSFCWGSWILIEGAPPSYAIESALLIYYFGLSQGFQRAHIDVRRGNKSVWKFHEKFGAVRVHESEEDFFYEIRKIDIVNSLIRHKKYLPNGFEVLI